MKKNITFPNVAGAILVIAMLMVVTPRVQSLFAVQSDIILAPGDEITIRCEPGSRMTGPRTARRIICPTLTPAVTFTKTPTRMTTLVSTPSRANTPTVTLTVPRTATRTDTPVAVTLTPSKTNTPSSGGNIQPFANAPLCPTHNDTAWHGLWDSARGCHYDHTHNDDPAMGNTIFGPVQYSQNISYPWLTSNENDLHGHGGYKYYVNVAPTPACSFESYDYLGTNLNCVSAFRIQYHDAGTNAHMVKRFHSYYMEVRITKGNVTGIIRTGGWADFGCLHKSYKESFLPLPGIDPVQANGQTYCGAAGGQSIHSDPYRGFGSTWAEIQGQTSGDNFAIWTTNDTYGYNRLGRFFFRTLDDFGAIDAADPYADHFLCPTFTCKYNNSEHNVFNVFMTIPASMDNLDGVIDGKVTYTGYTNRSGDLMSGCLAPNSNCVPLQMTNVPVGTAIWSRNLSGLRPAGDPIRDHDIYFNNQPSSWIIP